MTITDWELKSDHRSVTLEAGSIYESTCRGQDSQSISLWLPADTKMIAYLDAMEFAGGKPTEEPWGLRHCDMNVEFSNIKYIFQI